MTIDILKIVQENPEKNNGKIHSTFLELFFGISFSKFFFSLPSLPQKK
jgi:hypothetical protein